jgi:integrase
MLTDVEIRKLPPPPAGGRVEKLDAGYDGAGALYIVVQPTGARSWAFRYSHHGKARKLTIGRYPGLGLADARKEARRLGVEVERGADPCADKAAVKASTAPAPVVRTVAKVADEFLKRHTDVRNGERWARKVRRILAKEVVPVIGAKPIAEVTKADIRDMIDGIADGDGKRAPAPIMANRTLAVVAKLCRWSLGRDYIDRDPTAGLPKPGTETKRDRVLTDAELASVWRAADGLGYPYGPAIKLLILTGARREEVGAMRRSEIAPGKWTLPASRSKNKLDHITPLSAPAMAVLNGLPRIGRSDLLFTTNGVTPASGWSTAKATLDRLSGVTHWVVHDLRRTLATGMGEGLGIAPHVVEAVLGHVVKGIAGVYNRSGYLREKGEALDLWAKHVEEIAKVEQVQSEIAQ